MLATYKRMSFLTFEGLSTTFEGLTNVYHSTNLLIFVNIGDNTCTTVHQQSTFNMKIIKHTCNSLVKPTFINSLLM